MKDENELEHEAASQLEAEDEDAGRERRVERAGELESMAARVRRWTAVTRDVKRR